jgi:metallopeptidase MepB
MHDQLRRVFQELGHAMHNILSKTKCARLHGTGENRDFAKAIGIMFENFLWTTKHMKDISLHYSYLSDEYFEAWRKANPDIEQPEENIGDELIERLVQLKGVGVAAREIDKVWMARFDMKIHSPQTHEEMLNMDFQVLYNKIRVEATGLAGPEVLADSSNNEEAWRWGHGYSGFRAIAGGYDAGYYTQTLSQVYSFDLFREGFRGDTTNEENGRRFRKMVLEPGGSVDAMKIMKEFLGREVDEGAYWEGIGM